MLGPYKKESLLFILLIRKTNLSAKKCIILKKILQF